MMTEPQKTFDLVLEHARDTAKLEAALALLEWDEHTYMPPDGGAYRAEQVGLLSGLIHERRTSDQLGAWLKELSDSPLAQPRQEPIGAALRRFKKLLECSGLQKELRKRRHFEKPCEVRRRAELRKQSAARKARALAGGW